VVKTAFGRAAMAMAAGTTLAVAAGLAWTVVKLSLDDFEWAAGLGEGKLGFGIRGV